MNEIILERLHEQLERITQGKNIFVLKGVSLSLIGEENFQENLSLAADNPLNYFIALMNSGRKFLTHEEFLLLNAVIFMQYDAVYVLKNNLYMEQFPIEAKFDAATKKILLEHFSEPENVIDEPEEENLGNASKLTELFVGLKDNENFLLGVYNDEQILSEPQVKVLNLFNAIDELVEVNLSDAPNFFDLQEEVDFVAFIREIISAPHDKIFVRTHNYAGDKEKLHAHLKTLAAQIKIFCVRPEEFKFGFEHRDDFTEILKRHWGYDTFRTFKVYDLPSLDKGEKNIRDVSQEQIISDIVQQVENCMAGDDIQDIFVTAPTGAGKSVIFQIPAIYLAEKYNLLTIVISPLIGLMNDQVKNLTLKNYRQAETINSDISPILKEQIVEKITSGACDILYISPETLMSRNDIEQLIGDREIGLIAIDEAHIVTTWGKEFRPDYWYMGDRIKKMREKYSFIIATFTATAIYHGEEDMYWQIIDMLHMSDPITYLGYVKREDIDIVIDRSPLQQKDKSDDIKKAVQDAGLRRKKTLIYFPWVKSLDDAFNKLGSHSHAVTIYHAKLWKGDKQKALERFANGQAWVVMATKAFGMGIDIDDIKVVMHFAPTGNVCDYVQEIGRAARRENLRGEARYHYAPKDFKYVKFFHRMAINKYQLHDVIKKICEIYRRNPKNNLLLDADNFSYIFYNADDEDDTINKVKIALLIIQKDLESKRGFPPLFVRPWPLYSHGYFKTDKPDMIQENYGGIEPLDPSKNIYRVNLKHIWENNFRSETFPQFKRRIYSRDTTLPAELQTIRAAYIVTIDFKDDFKAVFDKLFEAFKETIAKVFTKKLTNNSATIDDLSAEFGKISGLPKHKAQNICEIFIASMDSYESKVFKRNTDKETYTFYYSFPQYFRWFRDKFKEIAANTTKGKFYITGDKKEYAAVLGVLEAMGVLNFDIMGGSNNQICVHINQISVLQNIANQRNYSNRILSKMDKQRDISLAMLEYIYENPFDSATIWDLLEDYFLGKIPDAIKI